MNTQLTIPPSVRLRFRLMDESDADLLFDLDQDPEVMRYLNDGMPTPREEIDDYFVPRMMDITDPVTGHGIWEVADRRGGNYLGWILVRDYGFATDYHEPGNIELGWRLKRECWGRGIATEAALAIMEVLRLRPDVEKFCAIADPDNLGSIGVMKKLGMQFVKQTVHVTPKVTLDVDYYEMKFGDRPRFPAGTTQPVPDY